MLEISLFGELSVRRDGACVALPQSRKTRALLAYLILNEGWHRRERLCELFWQIPDDPRQSLRWSLSKLRGVVNNAAERITADRERAAFEPHGATVDFLEAIKARAADFGGMSVAELERFADLTRGVFLDGLDLSGQPDFESWRMAEQERARRLRLDILRALIDRLEDDPGAQAERLSEAVAIEPYDPDLHRRLIAALMRAGRTKDAKRQREASDKVLADIDGYSAKRLTDALTERPVAASQPARAVKREEAPLRQEVRFCKSRDGTKIAWASVGDGPPIVKTANWLNHLEFDWESPVWRHVFRGLSQNNRFIRYDSRGNGLSDWSVDNYEVETLTDDLDAVVEASGVDKFSLLAVSQGCAIAVSYAVRRPDRVRRLILIGGYARGWNRINAPKVVEQTEAMVTLMRMGWGQDNPVFRQLFTSLFMPDAPPQNHEWFNELQRVTTSPENAARILRACGEVDVTHLLQKVTAPTLVIHARGDMRVPFNSGRELAAGITDARFVALDTRNHLIPEDDPVWPRLVREIAAFLE